MKGEVKILGDASLKPALSNGMRFKKGFTDIVFMVLIIGAVFYFLYRSVWKKKGHCIGEAIPKRAM